MKKIISLLSVLALIATLCVFATGCKSSTDSASDGGKKSSATIPGGTADVSEEVLEALSKSGNISMYDFDSEDKEITGWTEDFAEYYKEVYGGTFEKIATAWEGWEDKYLTDFAANDAPDLIYLFAKNWPKLANRGIVYSVKEMKDKGVVAFDHPVIQSDIDLVENCFKYKDELYIFATNSAEADMLYVNEDIFKSKGVKSPGEYYAEGLWNWDNFIKCATAVTEDTNGDGATDMYGYGGWDGTFIVSGAGGKFVKMQDNGKLVNGLEDVATVRGLENYREVIGVKKIGITSGANLGQNVAMKAVLPSNEYENLISKNYKFNWIMLPFPLDLSTNKEGTYPGSVSGWAVSSSSENPQGCINYIIASRVYEKINPRPDTKDYSKVYTDQQLDMLRDCTRNCTQAIYQGVGNLWSLQWNFWTALKGGKKEVSEVIGSYKSMFDAQIEGENQSATN